MLNDFNTNYTFNNITVINYYWLLPVLSAIPVFIFIVTNQISSVELWRWNDGDGMLKAKKKN